MAYFVVAFDEATDAIYENWGIGLDYPDRSGCSVFTLGMNIDYLGELFAGDPIRVVTTLIEYNGKRIHYIHQMYHDGTEDLVATNQCLCMNVNLNSRKSQPFPDSVCATLEATVLVADTPEGFGRTLKIRRR